MNTNKIINSKFFTTISSLSLMVTYLFFLNNHAKTIIDGTNHKITILFLIMESIIVILLIIRRQPIKTSSSAAAWFFSFLGTFVTVLYSPNSTETINYILGTLLMILGSILAIISYVSLNTSFAIVPAIRKIKTNGLYGFIRHPMYFSYFILHSGYILLNFSIYNLVLVLILFISLVARIYYEEKILSTDKKYTEYKKRVKYRLIPYIY